SCVICDSAKSTIKYFIQHYLEAKETLQPVYYSEIPVITPAGKQTYQSGWLIPRVKDGVYNGMICIVEDIKNQKRTQNALTESKAKYQELVENANSIIMQMDLSGNVTFFNKFAQMFFGFPEEEIIGRNIVGTIVPSEERFVHQVERMLQGIGRHPERYSNVEYTNTLKSGERVWVAWTNKALFDEHDQVKEILCIGNDITARRGSVEALRAYRIHLENVVRKRTAELKRANEALRVEISERKWAEEVIRSSEKKYRLVAENATEGIIVSQDGFFKYANPKAIMIFGYLEEELLARPFIDFIHPDDRDLVMERYLKRLKGDHLPHYSCRIIDRDGNVKWIEINAVLIPWMGRPATLTFFNNVTERKLT
ncbi:MAG: PAS domain S-box protein, partial [Candidatus Methanoperedens sp.]|nr:PAS domain S-box protein [Candidatus Methanoperedens sp.]